MAMTERELELMFRDWLRDLCAKLDNTAREGGIPSTKAAQIVAQECMHMAAYFVAHGSKIPIGEFAADCASMVLWHRQHPPEILKSGNETPPKITLN